MAKRGDLYWAVLERLRSWPLHDGVFLHDIGANRGNLDGPTLRRIARQYGVNRGIKAKVAGVDVHADALARYINDERPWPEGLVERAHRCIALAQRVRKDHTHGLQLSAATKFSW